MHDEIISVELKVINYIDALTMRAIDADGVTWIVELRNDGPVSFRVSPGCWAVFSGPSSMRRIETKDTNHVR